MGDADLPGFSAPARGGVAGVHDDLAHLGRDFHPGKGAGEGLLVHMGVVENPGAEDLVVQRFDAEGVGILFPSGIGRGDGHVEAEHAGRRPGGANLENVGVDALAHEKKTVEIDAAINPAFFILISPVPFSILAAAPAVSSYHSGSRALRGAFVAPALWPG